MSVNARWAASGANASKRRLRSGTVFSLVTMSAEGFRIAPGVMLSSTESSLCDFLCKSARNSLDLGGGGPRLHTEWELKVVSPGRLSFKTLSDGLVSFVLVAAALTLIYRNVFGNANQPREAAEIPSEPLQVDEAAVRGSKDAKTVMIVYSDFQCPFCRRFARDVLPEIERRYISTARVALVFRHLPLPIHSQAVQAAAIAECAGQQGRFWEMHDRLFAEEQLNADTLRVISKSLPLDEPLFDTCLGDRAIGERIATSVAEANALGIRSTPSFFLGQRLADGRVDVVRVLSGLRPEQLIRDLDSVLGGEGTSFRSWFRRFTS